MMLAIEAVTVSYVMLGLAFPLMASNFETEQVAWVLTATALAGGAFAPVVGKLADAYGKRKLFIIVCGLALAGFILSAVAPTFGLFVLGRAMAGPLSSTIFLGYSLMRDIFPARTLNLGVSISSAGTAFFSIPFPLIASYLLATSLGFRSLLWVLAAMTMLSIVLVLLSTPETTVRTPSKIDLGGVAMTISWITAILLGISYGSAWGWTSPGILGLFGAGAVILLLWIVYSLKQSDPFIDIRFVKSGSMLGICLSTACIMGSISTYVFVLPMVVQMDPAAGLGYGLGMSTAGYTAVLAPQAVFAIAGGIAAGKLSRKIRPVYLSMTGCAFIAVGFIGLALSHQVLELVIFWMILEGIGSGIALACVALLVLHAVPIRLQAQMASLTMVAGSLLGSATPVITTALMAGGMIVVQPTATNPNGGYMYNNEAITNAFLFVGILAAVGLVVVAATLLKRREAERTAAVESEIEALGVAKTLVAGDGQEPEKVSVR
ncbi:MAG: MFS transporter [Actinomycetota bacterium]